MARFAFFPAKSSGFAIAAAMMAVGTLGAIAIATPAYAQKQAKFSKEFLAAFQPIDEAIKGENPDYAALRAQAEAAKDTVKTDDERFFYGSTMYTIGGKLNDVALQLEGMNMMLDSGKVPEANVPQYTYVAGQLAFNSQDWASARARFEKAIELGYEVEQARALIARTYSQEGDFTAALQTVNDQINEQIAVGGAPDETLLKRGLTTAYNNDLFEDATNYSLMLVKYYPSATTWADAVAIQRNFGQWSDAEMLDLLRLARAANAMREARDYTDYIDAANFRRLPAEVAAVTAEGISSGKLKSSDTFVAEAQRESQSRTAGLKADLGALESDAKASGASASLAVAAGDAYLNFDNGAKAAELYELALTRPDVDRSLALTRLGIAQVKAGDYAAAQETLGKVQGQRASIAKLWAAYAKQQAG